MSFLNKLFGKEVKYTEDTNLPTRHRGYINPFEVNDPIPDKYEITIPVGGQFSYTHNVHGSVGSWWESEYDKTDFEMRASSHSVNPEISDMPGGDKSVKCETFTALRKGTFQILINHDFRGKIIQVVTIKVRVC